MIQEHVNSIIRVYNDPDIHDLTTIHKCIKSQVQGAQWIHLRVSNQGNVWTPTGKTNQI